jgi:hypothetical protein
VFYTLSQLRHLLGLTGKLRERLIGEEVIRIKCLSPIGLIGLDLKNSHRQRSLPNLAQTPLSGSEKRPEYKLAGLAVWVFESRHISQQRNLESMTCLEFSWMKLFAHSFRSFHTTNIRSLLLFCLMGVNRARVF